MLYSSQKAVEVQGSSRKKVLNTKEYVNLLSKEVESNSSLR